MTKTCCICLKKYENHYNQKLVCNDKECKIVYKMLAVHGRGNPAPKNHVWHSYSSDNPRWTKLPSRKIVEQKLKEITAKNFLLEKLTESEFLNKLEYGSNFGFDKEYCNPNPLKFKTYEYEKQRRAFNTR